MKYFLMTCMLVIASLAWAGESTSSNPHESVVRGEVLEVKEVASYTYLRLKTDAGEIWAAVMKASVKKGDTVSLENPTVMRNFESKTLKRTFPMILFATLGGSGGSAPVASAPGGGHALGTAYSTLPARKLDSINADVHVAKASGANARTVAEITTRSLELKDKKVVVRGRVVKYNPEIMGKNWIHLQDGTGSAADNTNDILVTSRSQTKIGDVVTAKGIVRTNKDFGAGYAYKVLIEEATLQ